MFVARIRTYRGFAFYRANIVVERSTALHVGPIRFVEIEAELEAIAEGHVVDGDPATVEGELLDEQDEIEYRLGVHYFEVRDASGTGGTGSQCDS